MDEESKHQDGVMSESFETSPVSESDSGVASGISSEDVSQTGTEMEQELAFLRQEVRTHVTTIQRLQTALYEQQARANVAAVSLRTQLRKKEQQLRQQGAQHDQRMSAILSHLLFLEGQLVKEQQQIAEVLHEKDDVIRRQRAAIEELATRNKKLLEALKEAHGYSGTNGILGPGGSEGCVGGGSPQVVLRNKDRGSAGYKVMFNNVKDKLRRHKSSLELYRSDGSDTTSEGPLRFGSQENLSSAAGGLSSDELKKARLLERKVKCRSMVDYPFRLNDLPEVSSEAERGKTDSTLSDSEQDLSQDSPVGSTQRLHVAEDAVSLEERPHSGRQAGEELSRHASSSYGDLPRSPSLPQSLSVVPEQAAPHGVKERPHSLTSVEVVSMERVSMCPSPTSPTPPGTSDSNPFKSFRNVFKRRNSKQRTKKRPASLGQDTNKEYHETLKEHFKKYDLQ